MLDLLASHLSPGARVLDIGCGTGRQAHALAETGHRVTALDLDFDALSTARELWPSPSGNPAYLAGDARRLPCPDAAFDAVACVDVLHWAAGAGEFGILWDEAWRVLVVGGLFLVRIPWRDSLRATVPGAGEGPGTAGEPGGWFIPDGPGLEARLRRAGGTWVEPPRLEPASTRAGTPGHALMLARKG